MNIPRPTIVPSIIFSFTVYLILLFFIEWGEKITALENTAARNIFAVLIPAVLLLSLWMLSFSIASSPAVERLVAPFPRFLKFILKGFVLPMLVGVVFFMAILLTLELL